MSHQSTVLPIRIGVFQTIDQARLAVVGLLAAGFKREQLAVICSDKTKEAQFRDIPKRDPSGSHTPEGMVIGGAVGAILAGLGLAVASVATGGLTLLIAGPAVIGGGALAGTFTGAMMTRGFEKSIADYYDQAVQRGEILVAVELDDSTDADRLTAAEDILAEAGAEPIRLPEG